MTECWRHCERATCTVLIHEVMGGETSSSENVIFSLDVKADILLAAIWGGKPTSPPVAPADASDENGSLLCPIPPIEADGGGNCPSLLLAADTSRSPMGEGIPLFPPSSNRRNLGRKFHPEALLDLSVAFALFFLFMEPKGSTSKNF